jgi:hypothetical protein
MPTLISTTRGVVQVMIGLLVRLNRAIGRELRDGATLQANAADGKPHDRREIASGFGIAESGRPDG